MNDLLVRLAPTLALCLVPPVVAQPGGADPADAKASAPALHYRSAFDDYKLWQDIKPGNWRELNDRLAPAPGKAGGHASRTPAAGPAPAEKASVPAATAHSGHRATGGRP